MKLLSVTTSQMLKVKVDSCLVKVQSGALLNPACHRFTFNPAFEGSYYRRRNPKGIKMSSPQHGKETQRT